MEIHVSAFRCLGPEESLHYAVSTAIERGFDAEIWNLQIDDHGVISINYLPEEDFQLDMHLVSARLNALLEKQAFSFKSQFEETNWLADKYIQRSLGLDN